MREIPTKNGGGVVEAGRQMRESTEEDEKVVEAERVVVVWRWGGGVKEDRGRFDGGDEKKRGETDQPPWCFQARGAAGGLANLRSARRGASSAPSLQSDV